MARRIALGQYPSGFKLAVSRPGIDAASSSVDLDDLIFHSDTTPGNLLQTGTYTMPAAGPSDPVDTGFQKDFDLGMTVTSKMYLMALARPQNTGNIWNLIEFWDIYDYAAVHLGNTFMDGDWCSPFWWRSAIQAYGGGPLIEEFAGWKYRVIGSTLRINSRTPDALTVRYRIYEV